MRLLPLISPEMNIFFLSFPVRIGLGLIMITYLVPFINNYTTEFAKLLNKDVSGMGGRKPVQNVIDVSVPVKKVRLGVPPHH